MIHKESRASTSEMVFRFRDDLLDTYTREMATTPGLQVELNMVLDELDSLGAGIVRSSHRDSELRALGLSPDSPMFGKRVAYYFGLNPFDPAWVTITRESLEFNGVAVETFGFMDWKLDRPIHGQMTLFNKFDAENDFAGVTWPLRYVFDPEFVNDVSPSARRSSEDFRGVGFIGGEYRNNRRLGQPMLELTTGDETGGEVVPFLEGIDQLNAPNPRFSLADPTEYDDFRSMIARSLSPEWGGHTPTRGRVPNERDPDIGPLIYGDEKVAKILGHGHASEIMLSLIHI